MDIEIKIMFHVLLLAISILIGVHYLDDKQKHPANLHLLFLFGIGYIWIPIEFIYAIIRFIVLNYGTYLQWGL